MKDVVDVLFGAMVEEKLAEVELGYEVVVLEYDTGVLVTLAEVLVLDMFMALVVLVRVGSTGVETLLEVA